MAVSLSLACKSGRIARDESAVSTTASSVYQLHGDIEAIWAQTTFCEALDHLPPYCNPLASDTNCATVRRVGIARGESYATHSQQATSADTHLDLSALPASSHACNDSLGYSPLPKQPFWDVAMVFVALTPLP